MRQLYSSAAFAGKPKRGRRNIPATASHLMICCLIKRSAKLLFNSMVKKVADVIGGMVA
jgi:hypothetical protein